MSDKPVVICYGDNAYGDISSMAQYRKEEAHNVEVTRSYEYKGRHIYWLRSYGLHDWSISSPTPLTQEEIEQLP